MASSLSSVLSAEARPADLLGCETPRIWTPPLRRLTRKTTAGFECIEFAEDVLGISLFPWQKWLLIHALELLPDDTYRFRTVLLLVARQSGKSTLMQVLSLWRMFVDGAPLVIGTAQNLDVAEEQWQGAVDIAEGVDELAAEIEKVDKTNGKKALRLVTGERYKVAAASRRGGRGLSGDLILLDELREHQTWEAWGAVTKTTMARARAQIWAASNAGDAASVVLGLLRNLAHAALGNPDGLDDVDIPEDFEEEDDGDSLGIFEWSAVPGCSMRDRNGWAQANPSLNHPNGVTERAIASAARTDPEAVFRTEVLCQWVDKMSPGVIPITDWFADPCWNPTAEPSKPLAFALDVAPDGRAAAIGVSDGSYLRVIRYGEGTSWVAETCRAHRDRFTEMFLDPAGPAGALLQDLEDAGVTVRNVSLREHQQACGAFLTAVTDHTVVHNGQAELDAAVTNADRRTVGDGGWLWSRKRSSVDISPLVAVTLARWAASEAVGEADFFTI